MGVHALEGHDLVRVGAALLTVAAVRELVVVRRAPRHRTALAGDRKRACAEQALV